MIGPLPTAPGGFNRVLVAIDKFTKWIKVKPVTFLKADRVLDFLDELVHRYGLPHRIIIDLGSNFNNHQFWEYCENSGIDVRYVSVAHPRANGQVERANGMVLDALNKRLHDVANTKGGKWIKELPNALWELRTQPTKPTGQSPYFLVYGSEAILLADIMWDSPAVEQYDEDISEDSRRVDIDGLEEARCAALVQSARYLEGIRHYHDRNVKECSFNLGDLVLRCIQNTEGLHKLSSPWEGPFSIAKVTRPGSYRLQTLEGNNVSNSWNIDQLCDSTRSLSTTPGVQVYAATSGPFAVSGLWVQALVSGLLYSKIQHQWLLTDLGLFRASRTLAAVYKETMYS
jgi:hypothetical protein